MSDLNGEPTVEKKKLATPQLRKVADIRHVTALAIGTPEAVTAIEAHANAMMKWDSTVVVDVLGPFSSYSDEALLTYDVVTATTVFEGDPLPDDGAELIERVNRLRIPAQNYVVIKPVVN